MNTLKYILCSAAICSTVAVAQESYTVSGVVLDDQNNPVADAVVSSIGHGMVRTNNDGSFEMQNLAKWATVRIQANGFYTKEIRVQSNVENVSVILIPQDLRNYNQTLLNGMAENSEGLENTYGVQNVAKKDFSLGAVTLDKALQGKFTGLQVVQKGGMTGEGSNLSVRGIRSLVAETNPLIVINGVPYMPDLKESQLIGGYSRSIFQTINPQDIANVTLLTGAEASAWGSLGSNGVLLIETDGAKSDNVDTRVTFTGSFGLNWQNNRLPLMNASEYKSYLSDIAMDYYNNDMGSFFSDFGFMSSPSANMAHLYVFDTNWQDQIYSNSATHDYLFRVEGGDAIAKYDISLGYTGDQGVLKETKSDRFQAQINANVLVSKRWELNANVNLAYLNGSYQEQGYSLETNPLLAAYRRAPILSPYQSSKIPSEDGSYALINKYSSYYLGSITNTDFIVSNPLSIVNTADGSIHQYDMNARAQVLYRPMTDLSLAVSLGLYTNFDKEKLFMPGVDNSDIVPRFDNYGEADNTTQVGEGTVVNFYYGVNAQYKHVWDKIHSLDARAGFQVVKSQTEYDMATGRNTPNDFYQTMGDAQTIGRYFEGYNNQWNWLNGYAQANYTYANYARAGVVVSFDGASSVGSDANRIAFYPGVNAAAMLGNMPFLADAASSWLDKLDVFADYSVTGNSRYSSKYGQYYYTSQPYQTIAGIVRANVPNTKLEPEKDYTMQVGADISAIHNRANFRVAYYNTNAKNVLMLGSNSSALGTSPYYCNDGEINNKGIEFSVNAVPFQNRDWRWTVGFNATTLNSEVKSLGSISSYITSLSDGGEIITRVGENPYAFYGYRTDGVYSTTADATAANLKNRNGVAYEAGDVKFIDQNGDGIINDDDKVVLGSATPDLYGSIFTSVEYKGFAIDLNFVFSQGNEAYNAVRRITESSSDFANQSKSVTRRWQNEGDITTMPRANYGDVVGNNSMSDRFVEDASYLKLRDITVSYTWDKKLWNIIQSGTIYVSGQNLLCMTDYLGLDPEFAYSNSASMMGVDYAKVSLPKSVKVGVNLKF
ncbi:MAG: SusC/RagA family TonB-linked outer membrane protein [Bacteroidales bacterium]|nr:SusC/RagA family TonB-linked outer membrane protein [Bacteroidales bacterium]